MDYGLWTMDYGLWTMDYGLWTMDYGLWTMDYGLGGNSRSPFYFSAPAIFNVSVKSNTFIVYSL